MASLATGTRLPENSLFLGLDSSTQSLKVTALDSKLKVVASEAIQFDVSLPKYQTKDGVHRQEGGRVTAPPLMWAEALELLLGRLHEQSFPFGKVKGISGSGQQHGSVFWRKGARTLLKGLRAQESLVAQLSGGGRAFAVAESPVWMDSSTGQQCRAIERAVGGTQALATLTGSRAYERYTGPQIRRVFETDPNAYAACERISLVSSFMASLLLCDYAAIDSTDAAGMNLMDIHTRAWDSRALEATAPGLAERLGPPAPPHSMAGKISNYWVERFGFDKDCDIVHWSGDNPCSLAGLALSRPGDLAISLGTSDTVFGVVAEPKPGLEGVVFPNPVSPRDFMVMLVYKNGSLTRQAIRDECAQGSWDVFNAALKNTPPLNGGRLGFYFTEPEIIPPMPAGTHRFVLVDGGGAEAVDAFDPETEVRAVVESQCLAMRAHVERIGMPSPPERLIATGGASANIELLFTLANVFGCPVYTAQRPDSAALGAALRAAHAYLCQAAPAGTSHVSFEDLLACGGDESCVQFTLAAQPGSKEVHAAYGEVLRRRNEVESKLVAKYSVV